jgi:hypothetical protein
MYTKVFRQILESTLVEDYVTRHIFIDLLILADQDGCVDMTPQVISRTLNVPIEVIQGAIEKLSEPDPHSRSHEEEGRRLVKIDPDSTWGWRIVNYLKYRRTVDDETRRNNNKVRKQRQRDRERENHAGVSVSQSESASVITCQPQSADVTPESQPVTLGHAMSRDVTAVTLGHAMSRQAEAEGKAEADKQRQCDRGRDPPLHKDRGVLTPKSQCQGKIPLLLFFFLKTRTTAKATARTAIILTKEKNHLLTSIPQRLPWQLRSQALNRRSKIPPRLLTQRTHRAAVL